MGERLQYCQEFSPSQVDVYSKCNHNKNPYKLLMGIEKCIIKYIYGGAKDPEQPIQCWRNRTNCSGITLPVFKTYYKVTVIKECVGERIDKSMEENGELK